MFSWLTLVWSLWCTCTCGCGGNGPRGQGWLDLKFSLHRLACVSLQGSLVAANTYKVISAPAQLIPSFVPTTGVPSSKRAISYLLLGEARILENIQHKGFCHHLQDRICQSNLRPQLTSHIPWEMKYVSQDAVRAACHNFFGISLRPDVS